MRRGLIAELLLVFASFLAAAVVQSWPLALHLTTHITAPVGSDGGAYVWNTWVFRYELIDRRGWPLDTTTILPLGGPADLSLHNYTVASNLLALPLQSLVGIVGAFNLIYLLNVALAGLGMYVLARRVWPDGTHGDRAAAWLAGLLFCCSPYLVARSTAHFSLVAAAPLPFFAACFDRAWLEHRWQSAAAAGACMAWAAWCDPYYAVYCLMLGAFIAAWHSCTIGFLPRRRGWMPLLDVPIALLGVLILARGLMGSSISLGPLTLSIRTLYTPVLLLVVLVVTRWGLTVRPRVTPAIDAPVRRIGTVLVLGLTAAILLAPLLSSLLLRAADNDFVSPPILWRSSAPGVDLAAIVAPNPNHPLAPGRLVAWISRQPGQYEENVASLPLVGLAVVAVAWWRAGAVVSRLWLSILLFFGSLSLGPFVRVADVLTYIPTPWTILRYVPIVSQARMPPRFSVIVVMALAVLFAGSLSALARGRPERRRGLFASIALLLAFELLPAPRTLHDATIPPVFEKIAADPREGRVLNIPYGIRDGLSSYGNFTAASLFFQTAHGKPIVGGYLSRVSPRVREAHLADPVLGVLAAASEGRPVDDESLAAAAGARSAFFARTQTRWVVIDEARASPALQALAVRLLELRFVERSGTLVLYEPAAMPSGDDAPHGTADTAEGTGQ